MRLFGRYRLTTFQIIAFSFLILVMTGTLLLMLPAASREAGSVCFSDCLFTATSAVCVTGLVVRDTFTSWTPFGQAVILLLIQIGGMGVFMATLRKKTEPASDSPSLIQTHVGIGYRMIRIDS